jgi:hypothetical protein
MPEWGCANDDKVAINIVSTATASASASLFIFSHLLSSLLALLWSNTYAAKNHRFMRRRNLTAF